MRNGMLRYKNLDFVDMANSVQIQLPIYIKAICDWLSSSEKAPHFPANMLYFHVDNPLIEEVSGSSPEWDEILKALRMNGLVLMQEGVSQISDKFAVFSAKSKASLDRINEICEGAFGKMQEQLNRLTQGDISLRPYKHNEKCACTFCDYKSVCRFDVRKEGNSYNYGKKVDECAASSN